MNRPGGRLKRVGLFFFYERSSAAATDCCASALLQTSSYPGLSRSRKSSDKAIAILGASRAYWFARWHRFVSIERREPLQTSLQGTSVRAMIFFMSGAPQRQQLASERTPLTSFAPAPSTVSCVPLTRNLSPEECSRRSEEKYYSIDSRYQTPTVLDFEKVFVYL